MMKELLNTPLFGIVLSIAAYEIGLLIYRRTKFPIFNPLLISIIIIIIFLSALKIDVETYNKGGALINFFLAPATIILAVPLYKQLDLLKKEFFNIIIGITVGCITSISVVYILSKVFKLEVVLLKSLIPKSITTPVGIELSKQIAGIPSITVAAIVITGITGAVIGPAVCKFFKITDKVAVGIAIGTSAHALGTTKAMELGETEGAMSSLAIGVAALITFFIVVFLMKSFPQIFI